MIPKVIHYVWLSNDPFPSKIKKCMETWQTIMPDYEIKRSLQATNTKPQRIVLLFIIAPIVGHQRGKRS